jgi:hypothetical protein
MASATVGGDTATQSYTAYVVQSGGQCVDLRRGGGGSRDRHRGRDNYK